MPIRSILDIILPIFLLIGAGYGIGRARIFSPEQIKGFARFVLLVALPALIFHSLATSPVQAIFQPRFLLVYGMASLASFLCGYMWFRMRGRKSGAVSAVRAMGMSCSNSAFIALPMMVQIFGPAGVRPIALSMIIENLLMLPLTFMLVEAGLGKHDSVGQAIRGIMVGLMRSSLLIAIVMGGLFCLFSLSLPTPVDKAVTILAGASAPLALMAIGAGLAGVALRGRINSIATISFGKLIVHPLMAVLLLSFFPIGDPLFRVSLLLLAAMPMASIFPLMAVRSDDVETCSAALLLATTLSFFTLMIALAVLHPVP